eukprot:CAMPEP_0179261550 /NCGR_PEP_ID=MMETSP0797-20121207/26919_1 /TAXON_ID=47934 /ORGANISM="Dinophysis acuminata, Strain DAEP01" /LENGTH=94 /DNA_ID=CAMNT_0020969677 /DNA_START=385 /DNA_END=669 /DNA_ORIENTATION=+
MVDALRGAGLRGKHQGGHADVAGLLFVVVAHRLLRVHHERSPRLGPRTPFQSRGHPCVVALAGVLQELVVHHDPVADPGAAPVGEMEGLLDLLL